MYLQFYLLLMLSHILSDFVFQGNRLKELRFPTNFNEKKSKKHLYNEFYKTIELIIQYLKENNIYDIWEKALWRIIELHIVNYKFQRFGLNKYYNLLKKYNTANSIDKQLYINKIQDKNKVVDLIKKMDFNSIFGGIFVGIANIIPGVSGGTMLVIFNLFDKLMYAINDIFKKKTTTRKDSIILLFKVLLGTGIGIILFAKLLGFTLKHFEIETIFCFMGLILFSVPIIIKDEMKNEKFNMS